MSGDRSTLSMPGVVFRDLIRKEIRKEMRAVDQVSMAVVADVGDWPMGDVNILLDGMTVTVPAGWAVGVIPFPGMRVVALGLRGGDSWVVGSSFEGSGSGGSWPWLTGSGVPASGLGEVDDLYLDVESGDVYLKTDESTWTLIINIMGPEGPEGPEGPQGPAGSVDSIPDGTEGAPALAFAADEDTGIWRPGSNLLGISAGGFEVFRAAGSGQVLAASWGDGSAPSFAFIDDENTGFYQPGAAADVIGAVVGGTEVFRIGGSGLSSDSAQVRADGGLTVRTSGLNEAVILRPTDLTSDRAAISLRDVDGAYLAEWRTDGDLRLPDGSAASPSLTFIDDQNTGLYRTGAADNPAMSAGGTRVQDWHLNSGNPQARFADGLATHPAITFIGDSNTGFYRVGADVLGVAVGGTNRVRFGTSPYMEFDFAGAGNEAIRFWETTGAGRSYAIRRTANFGGFQFVGISSVGAETVAYEIFDNGQFRVGDGSAAAPAITFIDDSNTGIYRPSSDIVAFATGGTLRGSFQADGFYATTPNSTGSAANLVTAGAAHNNFMRSTSARRYKTEITYDLEQLLAVELRPAKFYRPDDDAWYYGFIADDLGEQDPLLGTYDPETGEIENYDQRAVMAVMAAKINRLEKVEVQDHEKRLRALEDRVKELVA